MDVLLVDDHELFLEGMSNLLSANRYQVVGKARDGKEALRMARKLKPDLILMDINMNDIDGLTATRLIKNELPDIKIVMLTIVTEDECLINAVRSGADGYLLKNLGAEKFFSLLAKLTEGEPPLAPGMTAKLMEELEQQDNKYQESEKHIYNEHQKYTQTTEPESDLNKRHAEILSLLSSGKTYREIGDILAISEATVKYHMKNIMDKFNLKNKAEAIILAKEYSLGIANFNENIDS